MVGKIEKVALREIWKHEAHDFTTWLENNIDVLNSVLDFQLSPPEREKNTGNFNVDLVAEDENGNIVVIENQLEKSNHDHLGKVITYLASVGATKAIWIVSEPRQEHVKAMSWLNESTSAEFYLFKIEGIKIGNSAPAPLLTLIVGPSDEVREAGQTKKEYAERHHLRKEFWQFLLEKAKEKTKLHSNISPGMYSWIGTGAGIGGVSFNYVIGQHEAKVELYIDHDKETGERNKEIFDKLFESKKEIEEKFEGTLEWERLDGKRACRIAKYFEGVGYKDNDKWEVLCEQMIISMIKLEKALTPFIQKIKAL
jgi:Domain of unknown function (DUF4268)